MICVYTENISAALFSRWCHTRFREQYASMLINTAVYTMVYTARVTAHVSHVLYVCNRDLRPIFRLQVYILPFYARNYSHCVMGSEPFQNTGDLRTTLYLNASSVYAQTEHSLLLC